MDNNSSYQTGFILSFSLQDGHGLISGDDGKRYYFYSASWKAKENPEEGMKVEFNIRDNEAISIYKNLRDQESNNKKTPNNIKGFNWGALLIALPWSIGNKVWIGLLSIIPYAGIGIAIYLGIKGNELAWQASNWKSIERFKEVQRNWAVAGIIVTGLFFIIGFIIGLS